MENFTPVSALIGGVLIGAASALMLLLNGRITGVSGIFGGLLQFKPGETAWRLSFVLGLLAGGVLLVLYHPQSLEIDIPYSAPVVLLAGLLVGIGSRMGSGCTSGHGICGVGRLAPRSLVATVVFVSCGFLAASLFRSLLVGSGA